MAVLVDKTTKNNCRSRHFTVFIQTQKRHPTSFHKIRILTEKLLLISRQKFSCDINSSGTYF